MSNRDKFIIGHMYYDKDRYETNQRIPEGHDGWWSNIHLNEEKATVVVDLLNYREGIVCQHEFGLEHWLNSKGKNVKFNSIKVHTFDDGEVLTFEKIYNNMDKKTKLLFNFQKGRRIYTKHLPDHWYKIIDAHIRDGVMGGPVPEWGEDHE